MAYQELDPKELEATPTEEEVLPIVSLLTREQIGAMLTESQSELAKIDQVHATQREQIAKIDKDLRPSVVQERTNAIKQAGQSTITAALLAIRSNAKAAKAQERFWSPLAVRLRATFDNDLSTDSVARLSWIAKAEKLDGVLLVELAALAAATGSLAIAAVVEAEMNNRNSDGADPRTVNPGYRDQIRTMINGIPSASAEVMATLAEIQLLDKRAGIAAAGKSSGFDKISLGLKSGQIPRAGYMNM